jgi:uncharacterized membrane protein YhaH (DUF805 family)
MTPLPSLLSPRGRLTRLPFVLASLALVALFVVLYQGLDATLGRTSTWLLYPPLFWAAFVLGSRRCHDRGRSALFLLWLLLPILGPLWVGIELVLLRGSDGTNRFGTDALAPSLDYFQVP